MGQNAKTFFVYNTPIGHITLSADGTSIIGLAFGMVELPGQHAATSLTNEAADQIQKYLAGKLSSFALPLKAQGTDFQQNIWTTLAKIPYAATSTYADIAYAIGKPTSAKAVSLACNKNPIPIIIPSHRVCGQNGAIGSYSADIKIKRYLIDLEQMTQQKEP